MSEPLVLQPVLDLKAAEPLKVAFIERRGQSLEIDASAVQRLGGLCLQVLLSARKTWAEDGQSLLIGARSEIFNENMRTFGAEGRFEYAGADGVNV